MADDERLLYGLTPYDLPLPGPAPLIPAYRPLLMHRREPPRYAWQPLPEGTARVTLTDDYYAGAGWSDLTEGQSASPEDVFDIPAAQRDGWLAAQDAYHAMQDEITALMEQRILARRDDA